MPSVIRIQVQGKVKAATYQDMTSHPALTDLDTMIPLIQALIPLGLRRSLFDLPRRPETGTSFMALGFENRECPWG